MDPYLLSFLLNISSSMAWDGVKKLIIKNRKSTSETQALNDLTSTMEDFCNYINCAFVETFTMNRFLNAIRKFRDTKWFLRNAIEDACLQQITDEQFSKWVDLYMEKTHKSVETFIERDQTKTRIRAKLRIEASNSYGNFEDVINSINSAFKYSWKQNVIDLLEPLNLDLSFAMKPERYDVLLSYFKGLDADLKKLVQKKFLKNCLDNPHFNKVQLICGTSGSGKTHFIGEYTKRAYEQFGDLPVPCKVTSESLEKLNSDILDSLSHFLEIKCETFKEYSMLLDALSIRIVFVIENINNLLNDDWEKVVEIIKDITRFESFLFIVTINEYEYFQIEKDQDFLLQYCNENNGSSVFKHCFSINDFNNSQNVIRKILDEKYHAKKGFAYELSTPLEAIYYGECVCNEKDVSPPSSYYEYICKINEWKKGQVSSVELNQVLMEVIEQKNDEIKTNLDVSSFRKAQLLSLIQNHSAFEVIPVYKLHIYPYWAAKIVTSEKSENLLNYSDVLKEWLISCYIFYRYQEIKDDIDGLRNFFYDMHQDGNLAYAVFCAYKTDSRYIRELYNYLLEIKIDKPQLCYAVLRFINQCQLKVSEKFTLCAYIAEKILEFNLLDFYKRTLENLLSGVKKAESLTRDMQAFAFCDIEDINYISGYEIGKKYMELQEGVNVSVQTKKFIRNYIDKRNLEKAIESRKNNTYLDYFLRSYYEFYIKKHSDELLEIFTDLQSLINDIKYHKDPNEEKKATYRLYVKRNLTCAAGNVFEQGASQSYKKAYISIVRDFAEADDLFDRLTAWFMIRNSVSNIYDELDKHLLDILQVLKSDNRIVEKVGSEIDELISKQANKYSKKKHR